MNTKLNFIFALIPTMIMTQNVSAEDCIRIENYDGTYMEDCRNDSTKRYLSTYDHKGERVSQIRYDSNGKIESYGQWIPSDDESWLDVSYRESSDYMDFYYNLPNGLLITHEGEGSVYDSFLSDYGEGQQMYTYDDEGNIKNKIRFFSALECDENEVCKEYITDTEILEIYEQKDGILSAYNHNGDLIGQYKNISDKFANIQIQHQNKPEADRRRIYTVEEASKLVKPTGNTFKIRYR